MWVVTYGRNANNTCWCLLFEKCRARRKIVFRCDEGTSKLVVTNTFAYTAKIRRSNVERLFFFFLLRKKRYARKKCYDSFSVVYAIHVQKTRHAVSRIDSIFPVFGYWYTCVFGKTVHILCRTLSDVSVGYTSMHRMCHWCGERGS